MTLQHVSEPEARHKMLGDEGYEDHVWGFSLHAEERFRERFDGRLTKELAAEWRQWIRAGVCLKFPDPQGDRFRTIHLCQWAARNVLVPVVYDAFDDVIVTVLPAEFLRGEA